MRIKNKIFHKLIAMISVMAIFVSSVAPTVASALEFDLRITNMSPTGGSISSNNPLHTGSLHEIQKIYAFGPQDPLLCLEVNSRCMTGDSYHYKDSTDGDHWDNLGDWRRRDIGLIMHYGYWAPGGVHKNDAYWDATQLLVWEVSGYHWDNPHYRQLRSFNYDSPSSACDTPLINYYSSTRGDVAAVRNAYYEIINKVCWHYQTGFHSSEADARNSAIELVYNPDTSHYEVTLDSDTGLWNDFDWSSALEANGIHVVMQGTNRYLLWSDHSFDTIAISRLKQSTVNNDEHGVLVYYNTTRNVNDGQSIAQSCNPDTVTGWMALYANKPITPTGTLTITKDIQLADGAVADDSLYQDMTFQVRNSGGEYLVLDTLSAEQGLYQVSSTTANAEEASDIKLGTVSKTAILNKVEVGDYTVSEVNSGAAFTAEAADINVTVSADNTATAAFVNKETTTIVQILKRTSNGSNAVEGIHFILKGTTATGREYTADGYTNANGELLLPNIPIGEYTVYEDGSSVPIGYLTADEQGVSIKSGEESTLEFVNDTTKVQISKKAITGDDELPGAKLQVKDSSGKVVDEWTSTNEAHMIEGKLAAGEEYTLHEEIAPDGYVVANDITFTVSEDGSVDTVTMIDDTTKVQISKKAITGDNELAGAKLQVKDSTGKVVDEWTSTNEAHMIEGKLKAGEKYTLHEEIAPDGYVVANDITFTVSEDGSVDTVTMRDDIMKGTVEVHKTTEGMVNLGGIDLVLSGTSFLGNNVNMTATTDETGLAVFEGVPIGTYTITEDESTVPYGYLVADPIKGVEVVYAEVTDVDMYNTEMTGSISVQKTTEGMINLGGIDLVLSGVTDTGRDIELTATTDETGLAVFENVPVGTYTITEDESTVPYGYLVADPIEGVEVIYAEQTDVEIYNAEMTGSLRIHKKTAGMTHIGGIGFVLSGVTDTGREIKLSVATDETGLAIFKDIPVGTYTITEDGSTVPTGYFVAKPVTGVEVVYAEDTDITVVNESVPDTPKTGDTVSLAALTICILIAAGAISLKKRSKAK